MSGRTVEQGLVEALSNMCQAVQGHFDRNGRAPGMQELVGARAALDRVEAVAAGRKRWNSDERPTFSTEPHTCNERNCTRSSEVKHV